MEYNGGFNMNLDIDVTDSHETEKQHAPALSQRLAWRRPEVTISPIQEVVLTVGGGASEACCATHS